MASLANFHLKDGWSFLGYKWSLNSLKNKTSDLLYNTVYNKEAATYFQQAIDKCILCKYTHKPSGTAAPGPGKNRTLVLEDLKPREGIAVDLSVNLPITKDNYCHALTIVCLKTNYGQIYPLKTKTASEVCENIEHGWIKHFLKPK